MSAYVLLGRYSAEAIGEMGSDRTEKAVKLIRELGGKVVTMYALLGGYDLFLLVELPSSKHAMKASLGLTMLTGVSFSTFPAVTITDFDKLIGEL